MSEETLRERIEKIRKTPDILIGKLDGTSDRYSSFGIDDLEALIHAEVKAEKIELLNRLSVARVPVTYDDGAFGFAVSMDHIKFKRDRIEHAALTKEQE